MDNNKKRRPRPATSDSYVVNDMFEKHGYEYGAGKELAYKWGRSDDWVSKIRNGYSYPDIKEIERMADAIGYRLTLVPK